MRSSSLTVRQLEKDYTVTTARLHTSLLEISLYDDRMEPSSTLKTELSHRTKTHAEKKIIYFGQVRMVPSRKLYLHLFVPHHDTHALHITITASCSASDTEYNIFNNNYTNVERQLQHTVVVQTLVRRCGKPSDRARWRCRISRTPVHKIHYQIFFRRATEFPVQ